MEGDIGQMVSKWICVPLGMIDAKAEVEEMAVLKRDELAVCVNRLSYKHIIFF